MCQEPPHCAFVHALHENAVEANSTPAIPRQDSPYRKAINSDLARQYILKCFVLELPSCYSIPKDNNSNVGDNSAVIFLTNVLDCSLTYMLSNAVYINSMSSESFGPTPAEGPANVAVGDGSSLFVKLALRYFTA